MDSWQSADGRDIENELDQAEAYAKEQERQIEGAEESEAPEPQNAPQYGEPKPAPAEHQAVAQALAGTQYTHYGGVISPAFFNTARRKN